MNLHCKRFTELQTTKKAHYKLSVFIMSLGYLQNIQFDYLVRFTV